MGILNLAGTLGGAALYDWLWPWAGAAAGGFLALGLARLRRTGGLLCIAVTALLVAGFWWAYLSLPDGSLWQGAWFMATLAAAALATAAVLRRGQFAERWKAALVRRSILRTDARTDIRTVESLLPDAGEVYDPLRYCDRADAVFVGLDEKRVPVYLERDLWRASHVDIVGMTGSGKGVLAGVLLTQAVAQGEAVFVVDPKNDEYAPRVLQRAARSAGVPYHGLDLTARDPNWNPLQGATGEEIEQLFVSSFGLAERGSDADYYRLQDRKAARVCARLAAQRSDLNLAGLFAEFHKMSEARRAAMFGAALEEVAGDPGASAQGLDLEQAIRDGAVVYVRGSLRHPRVGRLQRMFVLSVIQRCERRAPGEGRPVCLFLDEFRYLISRAVLEALASIRDKRAHLVLAHQTLRDLHNVTADLDPEQVSASVAENCALKFSYRVHDPDTALWLARMSGSIRAEEEYRTLETDALYRERLRPDQGLRETERYLVDPNMLMALPRRCAVLYSNAPARFVFTAPVPVVPDPVERGGQTDASGRR